MNKIDSREKVKILFGGMTEALDAKDLESDKQFYERHVEPLQESDAKKCFELEEDFNEAVNDAGFEFAVMGYEAGFKDALTAKITIGGADAPATT